MSLSGFGIRITLASKNELESVEAGSTAQRPGFDPHYHTHKNIPSFLVFLEEFEKDCVNSSLNPR
jgi:hypothetical protein